MNKILPRIKRKTESIGNLFVQFAFVLLIGLGSLCNAEWNYGYWKKASSLEDVNEAKKEARDSRRPLLIVLSRGTSCSFCMTFWRNVACDGKLDHDSYCKLNNHPIVGFSKEKKIVMLYFEPSGDLSALASKITSDEYAPYLHRPSGYPVCFLVHVPKEAPCTTLDDTMLNVSTDSPDKVDFIAGGMGRGLKPIYDYLGEESGFTFSTNSSGFESFKSSLEGIFSDVSKTYGLTLEPPTETDGDYESATELVFAADSQTAMLNNLTLAEEQTESWFKFQADAGKKYWFKTSAAARGNATNELTFDFYKSSGSGASLAPVTKEPLDATSDDDGFALDTGALQPGMVFLKLSRTTATSTYSYNMKYRRTPNTEGGSISTATATVTAGKWTTDYTSAKNAGKPMVVAFVKDLWSNDAQALDAYVQTAAFTSAFGSTNYVLIRGPVDGITPDCSSVELFYLRADGSIVGRLTNQPKFVPAEGGTVVTVEDFTGANANLFPQFKTIATEATEESNNTRGGATDIVFEGDAMTATFAAKLGGVDTVDWYEFQTADTSETWILNFTSVSDGNVEVSLTDGDGNEKAPPASGNLKNGVLLNFKPEEEGEMMYLKVTSNTSNGSIASPIDYTLSVERKIVHYTVEFENATKRPLLSSRIVEIPVTIKENLAAAGNVSVKVKLMDCDNDMYVRLRPTATSTSNKSELTVTWTDEEKNSTPTKNVYLAIIQPEADSDEADWEGHKDVTLELQDVSENAALGDTNTMTIEVYSKADHAMFEAGDSASVDLTETGGELTIVAPPGTEDVYWKLAKGDIPEWLTIEVEKDGQGFKLILKQTKDEAIVGLKPDPFTIKLYSKVAETRTRIEDGGEIEISCNVLAALADFNPYGTSGTMFAGMVFDAESEIIDTKDVSGTVEVAVGEDALTATLTTSNGKVELTAPEWTESPEDKKILTTTMSGEKDGHAFELELKLGEDGAFIEEDSRLTVDKGTANEAVYGIQGKALLKEQDYEAALAGFGDYYTVDLQPVNVDDDLTAKEDGDMRGFGGMSFEINHANGTVAYKGFLPDGTRFEGMARLHVETPEGEDPYLEFAIFAEAKKGTAGTGQWIGSLNRISLRAVTDDGDKEICIACTTPLEPQSHPVWYRNEGAKQYMKSCGSIFDRQATLSEQLSTPPDNRYYLMVDKPPKLLNGEGEAVISPRRLELAEAEDKVIEGRMCFGTGDSLFGVALAYNVARQGQRTGDDTIDYGEFEGTIELYSLGFGKDKKKTVPVHGILVSASQFCCSSEIHPVGLGYYQLTETIDGQEVTTSYPVRLYWAKSLEKMDEVDKYLGEASAELKPSKANGVDLSAETVESVLNVSGLADGGAALEFSDASDVLAFSAKGEVEIFAEDDHVSLGGGHWTLCAVDLSGKKGEGTPLALTVSADVALSLSLKPGWNLIGVPATVVSLAIDSEAALMQYSPFMQEKRAIVHASWPLKSGSAYWLYAKKEAELQLAGELDETAEPQLPARGKLYFGADPGAEKRESGWIWKDGGFVEAEEENPSQGGWWMIK